MAVGLGVKAGAAARMAMLAPARMLPSISCSCGKDLACSWVRWSRSGVYSLCFDQLGAYTCICAALGAPLTGLVFRTLHVRC